MLNDVYDAISYSTLHNCSDWRKFNKRRVACSQTTKKISKYRKYEGHLEVNFEEFQFDLLIINLMWINLFISYLIHLWAIATYITVEEECKFTEFIWSTADLTDNLQVSIG